jgi:hypothetical protein
VTASVLPSQPRLAATAISDEPVRLGSRTSRALFGAGACALVGTAAGVDPRAGVAALGAVGACLVALHRPAIAAYVLVAIVPATSGLRPGLPVPGLRLSELLAGGVAGLLLVVARPGRTPPWRAFDWLALGYVVATAVLGGLDLVARGSQLGFAEASRLLGPLQFFLLYRALLTTLTSEQRRRTAIRLLLVASVPVSVLAILQEARAPGVVQFLAAVTDSQAYAENASSGIARATGPFPHWHDLGGYLFITVVLGVSLATSSSRALERRTLIAVIALAAVAGLSTVSFTPIAGAVAGSLWLVMTSRRVGRRLGGFAAFAVVLSLIFGPVIASRYHEQFTTSTPVKERPYLPQNVNFRIDVWTNEFAPVLRAHLLTGYGPDLPPGLGFTYTETIYVTLMLRGGLPLLLVYAGLMIAVAARSRDLKHDADPDRRAVARALAAGVVLIALMQFMTNYFVNAGFPYVFWVLAALVFSRDAT